MKRYLIYFSILFFSSFFFSCSQSDDVIVPDFGGSSKLINAAPIADSIKIRMNGIYTIENGGADFGKTVACVWNGNTFSVFTGKDFAYFIFKGGIIDSSIILEGYWRYAQDVLTGLASLQINPSEGGNLITKNDSSGQQIVMRGLFGSNSDQPNKNLVFRYSRPLPAEEKPFWIIAHRGGGRNSDNLPAPENSLEIIQLAQGFGANAIEIDARLTKDGVPILFHDEELSPRLIKGEFCVGPVSNYTFAHLRTFCTLKNDKPIPTLYEALETVVNKTCLSLVWIDIKVPEAIGPVIELQKTFMQKALSAGRKVEFLIGLPSEDIITEYLAKSPDKSAPSLCELEPSDVRRTKSSAWGPAWTRGPMYDEVQSIKNEGIRVFFWTLDGPEFIKVFLDKGNADGILSNYPSIVAYEYYLR